MSWVLDADSPYTYTHTRCADSGVSGVLRVQGIQFV